MPQQRQPIFTIGHSTHPWSNFVALLHQHRVDVVLDVRTTAYSRQAPQFNKEALIAQLPMEGIKYAHFQESFGARRNQVHLLDGAGRVVFSKVRQTAEFRAAIARVENGADQGYRTVLMCSEGNPFDCHRFAMIAYQFAQDGYEVLHILRDGRLRTQTDLEAELLERYAGQIPHPTFFEPNVTRAEQIEAAYQLRNLDIGWVDSRTTAA